MLIDDMKKWLTDGFNQIQKVHEEKVARVKGGTTSDQVITQFRITTTNVTVAGEATPEENYQDYRHDKIMKDLKRDPIKL